MTDITHGSDKSIHHDDYISVDNVVYIIMVDGKPKCYEFEHIKAKNKMLNYASKLINDNSNVYKCYMTETKNREIIITGIYKFFLISYESVLHTISLYNIPLS